MSGPAGRVSGADAKLPRRIGMFIAHWHLGVYGAVSFKTHVWRLDDMLITPAFAQSGGFAEGGLGLMPIILVMIIFYFLLIRPQQKRAKQHKEMLAAVRRGDKIVTNGGIMGTVIKAVDDSETIEVEITKDVKVNVVRTMIADVRSKTEPKSDAKS